jgi:hypothetical protein
VLVLAVAVAVVLVVGSLAEINAQSSGFRTSTNIGYGDLASQVVHASNRTGAQLATTMRGAPTLTNRVIPHTARAELQQSLDQAVQETSDEASQAARLVPPYPSDGVSTRLTAVMDDRAAATLRVRTTIDQLLGMSPPPIAGAPVSTSTAVVEPAVQVPQATTVMTAAGRLFEQADAAYRSLITLIRHRHLTIALPASVWVPAPKAQAPLGANQLGQSAAVLAGASALGSYPRLIISAVGLSPPAVATGSPSAIGDGCDHATSTVATAVPTVLPPTSSVTSAVTVTNCGTVSESGVVVTETLAVADPPGSPPPPARARGGTAHQTVSVPSGSSHSLTLPPLAVAGGHNYTLTVSLAIPVTQTVADGSSQQFFLQISA